MSTARGQSGQRSGFLREAYANLRGARVLNLQKKLLELSSLVAERQSGDAALRDSLARLIAAPGHPDGIAVISAMPPMETGIANFTRHSFRYASYPVDIYTEYTSFIEYANGTHDPFLADSGVNVFDVRALPLGRQLNRYAAEIYVLGNSVHNLPAYQALRRAAAARPTGEVWVHIHDPCLLHIVRQIAGSRNDFRAIICSGYPELVSGLDWQDVGQDASLLAERGIMGIRALMRDIPAKRIIVNSAAAADLLRADSPELSERVVQLFHPVFPTSLSASIERKGPRCIGTFGVPSSAKRTEIIVEAVQLLRRQVPDAMLLVAGYEAGRYAFEMDLHRLPFLRIEDSPSDLALQTLMQSVDVAVQLRHGNLGESSGVVPQLLACGIPVIVSAVGSFLEYGNAVRAVPQDVNAVKLAEILLEELRSCNGSRAMRIKQYTARHGPEEFCRRIMQALRPTRATA